jgi:tetraacyldisaccharide 4'-kinase
MITYMKSLPNPPLQKGGAVSLMHMGQGDSMFCGGPPGHESERADTMKNNFNQSIASWLVQSWYAPSSLHFPPSIPRLLDLGTKLYALGLHHHQRQARLRRRRLPAFVISVGNLVVGGAGKTPMALWLSRHLRTLGWNTAILSRGYKRRGASVSRVPPFHRSFREVLEFGDEPLLMARMAAPVPVWVGNDRWQSGTLAIQTDRADALILDDGFQHLALDRNLDLLLIDAHNPFGNGSLLPLGPLREPLAHLSRADAIVLTRADDPEKTEATRAEISKCFPQMPVFSSIHRLTGLRVGLDRQCLPLAALDGRKAVAFAGIARPESFYDSLRKAGIVLSLNFAFPDHHVYQAGDMMMLMKAMKESNAAFLVTTEKDMVRLSPEFQTFTLAAAMEIDFLGEEDAFRSFLQGKLPSR